MKILLIAIFMLAAANSHAQEQQMKIRLADGTVKTGMYKMRKPTLANSSSKLMLLSPEPKERYTLSQIASVTVYDSDTLYYEVVDVKKNSDEKRTEKKLGLLAYRGRKMDLYYVPETIHSGGTVGMHTTSGYFNAYVKRRTDTIAYNMGFIYGIKERGIIKRARDYFTDCPLLIENLENETIKKAETIDIVRFYEANCGN